MLVTDFLLNCYYYFYKGINAFQPFQLVNYVAFALVIGLGAATVMFFRERTSDWQQPKISAPVLAALIVAVVGVLYFGIFAGGVIERFSQSPPTGIASK